MGATRATLWTLLPLAVAAAPAEPALGQDQPPGAQGPPPDTEPEVEVTSAEVAVVQRLLASHTSAVEEQEATQIAAVLATMSGYDNPEFQPPAIAGLKYRASRVDQRAAQAQAEELGLSSRKDVTALVAEREASVQAAAAHVLANHPGDKAVLGALRKALRDKQVRKEKPAALAAVIRALGRLDDHGVEQEVERNLERANTKEVARACVRYFGQVETKDYKIVRKLCERLEPPQPLAVDDPDNPPAEYWAALWAQWDWTRRDVTWALTRITGQVFRPAEGEHPSDARKALAYVKEHREELGLR